AGQNDHPKGAAGELQMAVPGQGHEQVRRRQQQRGPDPAAHSAGSSAGASSSGRLSTRGVCSTGASSGRSLPSWSTERSSKRRAETITWLSSEPTNWLYLPTAESRALPTAAAWPPITDRRL